MPRVAKTKSKAKQGDGKQASIWKQNLGNWYRGQIARWRRPLTIAAFCLPVLGAVAGLCLPSSLSNFCSCSSSFCWASQNCFRRAPVL